MLLVDPNCPFCQAFRQKDDLIWQDNLFFALFDRHPVTPGHILLIPRRHATNIFELTSEEWINTPQILSALSSVLSQTNLKTVYEEYVNNAISPMSKAFCQRALDQLRKDEEISGYNFGVNQGIDAGQTVEHLHVHLIPRYKGDTENPTGGVRHVIPELGNYKG